MKTRFLLIAALLASFSSAAFSATIQELEEKIAHIEAVLAHIDADEDSFTPEEGDCDDSDAGTHPQASESEAGADGLDNDCDGIVDEDDYYESSGDAYGDDANGDASDSDNASDDDSDHDDSGADDADDHDGSDSDDGYDDSEHDSSGSDDSYDDDSDRGHDCRYWWQCLDSDSDHSDDDDDDDDDDGDGDD